MWDMKIIGKLTIFGTLGFAVGWAIGGALLVLEEPFLGFPISGAIGGASLGFALGGWRKAGILALVCAIGFGVGSLAAFFIVLAVWEPPGYVEGFFLGAVGGAVGGASLGLAFMSWGKAGLLALAGAVGFGIAGQVSWDLFRGSDQAVLGAVTKVAIWGVVGGAFLGATLGYLERKREVKNL